MRYGGTQRSGRRFTSYDQFFNMAGGGQAGISIGGLANHPAFTLRFGNLNWNTDQIARINGLAVNGPLHRYLQGVPGLANIERFPFVNPTAVSIGSAFPTQLRHWGNLDPNTGQVTAEGNIKWHYYADTNAGGEGANDQHTIIATGNADVPTNLHYRSLFLNQCNSFRYSVEAFKHGTVIGSWANIGNPRLTRKFVEGTVEGWNKATMEAELEVLQPGTNDPRVNRAAFEIVDF